MTKKVYVHVFKSRLLWIKRDAQNMNHMQSMYGPWSDPNLNKPAKNHILSLLGKSEHGLDIVGAIKVLLFC